MRRLAFLLALALLFPSAALAQTESVTLTIESPGTAAEMTELSRSFIKLRIDVLNERTYETDPTMGIVNPDYMFVSGAPQYLPWTIVDVDEANSTRVSDALNIVLQEEFEVGALLYDLQFAEETGDTTLIDPVLDRGQQTDIDDDWTGPRPCDDSEIVAWFDSDLGITITTDAEGPTSWIDRCGAGHNLVETTDSLQPQRLTIGGVNVIDFDGVDDRMRDSTFPDVDDEWTVIIGAEWTTSTGSQAVMAWGTGGSNSGMSLYRVGTSLQGRVRSGAVYTAAWSSSPTPPTPLAAAIAVRHDGTADTDIRLYENGVQRAIDTDVGAPSSTFDDLIVGNRGGFAWPFGGYVRDIIILNRKLTDSEIVEYSSYLMGRLPRP